MREFLNSAQKVLVVDSLDWLQIVMCLEGHCFR